MAKISTVDELKKALEQYDDDLPVGGVGHFNELLEFDIQGLRYAYTNDWKQHLKGKDTKSFKILELYIEDAGPDPD
ncbi:hypothetical protein PBI_SCTP2_223 [Salicola phage SCTP-2]|nr:hypothetical protein PBI_SCTP2_223 [Salicola phage SCTP-2]